MNSIGLIHWFLNKKVFVTIISILGTLSFTSVYAVNHQNSLLTQQFMINGAIYQLEIAQTQQQLQMGLMGRQSLALNKGMLFAFPSVRRHGIWMKNMSIPLTVAWLDTHFKVLHVAKLKPCFEKNCPIAKPLQASSYVVELNFDNQIAIGDQLKILMQYNPSFSSTIQ